MRATEHSSLSVGKKIYNDLTFSVSSGLFWERRGMQTSLGDSSGILKLTQGDALEVTTSPKIAYRTFIYGH